MHASWTYQAIQSAQHVGGGGLTFDSGKPVGNKFIVVTHPAIVNLSDFSTMGPTTLNIQEQPFPVLLLRYARVNLF